MTLASSTKLKITYTSTLAVDFETYYDRDYSLKKMDAYSYVHHPKFDCYLMSVYGHVPITALAHLESDECPPPYVLFQWCGHPKDFQHWHLFEGATLVAHNAAFDSLVFKRLQQQRIAPPFLQNLRWRCTAAMAVYFSAPRSLKGACKQLLNIDVDKTQRSKASGQSGADLFGNEALKTYALEDARLCFLLWDTFRDFWPAEEQALATLTFEWGQQGIGVDLQTLEKSIQTLEKQRFDAVQKLPWVEDFNEDTPLSHRQLALACREAGIPCPVSLAMDDPDCEAWEEKYGPEYPWVNAMRIFRRTNMLLSRFYTVRNRLVVFGRDGSPSRPPSDTCHPTPDTCFRFPYALKYFGAVPGRWSGDAGFNVQNMPRGELFGADLRSCFQPSEGNVFIIADLCQIEPRILAWIIEDEAFLSMVRSGVDIYEAHARATMGYSDSRPLKEVDPVKRALAKARVLGLGYGCGPQKFVSVAKKLGGLDITFAAAKKIVDDFRTKNRKISGLWCRLDRDFRLSAGGDYTVELPSGRALRYFDTVKTPRGFYTAKTERGGVSRSLYGCLLTENIVQATARDLFAEHLLQIHRAGIGRIVFHVHDEVIVEVPEARAEEACAQIQTIMSTTPDWLSGCPVAAEAGIFKRYTK